MARQARKIANWGQNVYVKIPITNTRGESAAIDSTISPTKVEAERHGVLSLRTGTDDGSSLIRRPCHRLGVRRTDR